VLRKIDRILLRVQSLPAAVKYYTDVLGLTLIKQDKRLASLRFADGDGEIVLHADADLPDQAVYFLVDDVRDFYARREELHLTFVHPPTRAARGWSATVKDPFGNVLLILDRAANQAEGLGAVEDAKPAGALFAGVETRVGVNRKALVAAYEKIGRTADDLPYTPHFESLFKAYVANMPEPQPTRAEVWRHLLNLRKSSKLPKLGPATSKPPEVLAEDRQRLRELLGEDIGKRDRLPYTERFDSIVDQFNNTQQRPLSPHLVWRLVATLAK
jgi:catechol 2,3-dioxygenase-like lactoylglutathione lyase family enzyme